MNITKTVIPAAGFGTRFLPFTKAVPKELLPLLNKPAIHYVIEEGKASGTNNFIIITTPEKQALQNYFSPAPKIDAFLKEKGKESLLQELNALIASTTFTYVNQAHALGLGHAVGLAKEHVGNEFFGIMLPDDIMISSPAALAQLIAVAREKNASVIAVQEVPKEATSAYGIISIKQELSDTLFEVADLVEKPKPEDAPSNLAIIGRYVLSPEIFPALEKITPSAGGELQLTDGMSLMMRSGHKIFAVKVAGARFDVGTPAGWLHANMSLAGK